MEKKNEIDYQFVAVPLNLFYCLDNNLRSMLFCLVQLSSYNENEAKDKGHVWDGWFLGSTCTLTALSNLSENLVRVTLDTLYQKGIIDVQCVGKGKGMNTPPNRIKIYWERFKDYEKYSIRECIEDPRMAINTLNYKGSNYRPSYLGKRDVVVTETVMVDDEVNEVVDDAVLDTVKSEDNINSINNKDNKKNINNKDNLEYNTNIYNSNNSLIDLNYYILSNIDFFDKSVIVSQFGELINNISKIDDSMELLSQMTGINRFITEHQECLISWRLEELRTKVQNEISRRYQQLIAKTNTDSN